MAGVEVSVTEICSASDVVSVDEASRAFTRSPRLSRKTQDEVVAENDTSSGEDPDNYPLHSTWSFWFDRSERGGTAGDFFANLRCLSTVTSIKAFWRVFNNLPTCDQLKDRESYHLMRDEKRRPVWEDVDNVDGGMWVIKVDKQHTVRTWQELLLAAIGEQFSESVHPDDEICGVSVRIRYDVDVIQIWNRDSDLNSHAVVIDKVKQLMPTLEIRNVYYSSNKEKMRESLAKPAGGHRGVSPPLPAMLGRRYPGAPPPFQPAPPPGSRPPFGIPHSYHQPPHIFRAPPPHFRPPRGIAPHQQLPHTPPHP